MHTLITNDVEEVSIVKNKLSFRTAQKVADKGLPRLLEIYNKYDVQGTFYFTGTFAESFPNSIKAVMDCGHEIG